MAEKKIKRGAQIYQLKVTLNDVRPAIWRRFQADGDISLVELHRCIQAVMDWKNCHMHEFVIKGEKYGMPDGGGEEVFDVKVYDGKKYKLSELVAQGDSFIYIYDFGDDWRHTVEVEEVLTVEARARYPRCVDGARACPPEDCGGPWGYEEMLEALKNPDHREYKHYREWLGGEFDPEGFDLNKVNGFFRKFSK